MILRTIVSKSNYLRNRIEFACLHSNWQQSFARVHVPVSVCRFFNIYDWSATAATLGVGGVNCRRLQGLRLHSSVSIDTITSPEMPMPASSACTRHSPREQRYKWIPTIPIAARLNISDSHILILSGRHVGNLLGKDLHHVRRLTNRDICECCGWFLRRVTSWSTQVCWS